MSVIVSINGVLQEASAHLETVASEEAQAVKLKLAREQRDRLLAASDWTQASDSPLNSAKKAEWATYRQALRDITSQTGFPATVEFPEKPAL